MLTILRRWLRRQTSNLEIAGSSPAWGSSSAFCCDELDVCEPTTTSAPSTQVSLSPQLCPNVRETAEMSQNCASFIYRLRSSVERTALQNSVVVRMAAVLARVCVEIAFAGPVSVLASVNGPIEVRTRDELVDRATLEINIRPVSGPPGKL